MIKIESLTERTLSDAVRLICEIFPPEEEEERADFELSASLAPEKYKEFLIETRILGLKYWVAMESEEVVGVIGLYSYQADDKEADWLGWFVVDPNKRDSGFGKELLRFAIRQAELKKKSFLRVYTSTMGAEAVARNLYKNFGFELKKEEPEGSELKLYYELRLKGGNK